MVPICEQRARGFHWELRFLIRLHSSIAADVHAQTVPTVKPVAGPWEAGQFIFPSHANKARKSLSGIACNTGAGSPCLVVFDEGTLAHYVVVSSSGYVIDNAAVPLRSSDEELDAEGATTDGKYFYVTGSHSAKRKTCESNPGSRHVIRFAIDPTSGRAKLDTSQHFADYKDTDALWRLMSSLPALSDSIGEQKCLRTEPPEKAPNLKGQRGVNIEGVAIRNGTLHFGFRGPAKDARAPILSVDAVALFESDTPKADATLVEVGEGRGIRDLVQVNDGVLVLAGPDDDVANEKAGWILGLWDGVHADVAKLKNVTGLGLDDVKLRKCDDELKPEALAVLRDVSDEYELVILADGMCDGGPLKFVIPRKPH
nr:MULTISPECIES: DUF3616 domain-containing protein [unclassified Bradyrhizobium]